MRRLIVLAAAAVAVTGCLAPMAPRDKPGLDPMNATPVTYDYEPSTMTKVGNAALSVPATVLWWPYKIGSSALRGAYDGVVGGVSQAPVPVVGIVAAPLTLAAGAVNGTVKGVGRGPAYLTPDTVGPNVGKPWTEPLPLWDRKP
jgi:hypothetical protein